MPTTLYCTVDLVNVLISTCPWHHSIALIAYYCFPLVPVQNGSELMLLGCLLFTPLLFSGGRPRHACLHALGARPHSVCFSSSFRPLSVSSALSSIRTQVRGLVIQVVGHVGTIPVSRVCLSIGFRGRVSCLGFWAATSPTWVDIRSSLFYLVIRLIGSDRHGDCDSVSCCGSSPAVGYCSCILSFYPPQVCTVIYTMYSLLVYLELLPSADQERVKPVT